MELCRARRVLVCIIRQEGGASYEYVLAVEEQLLRVRVRTGTAVCLLWIERTYLRYTRTSVQGDRGRHSFFVFESSSADIAAAAAAVIGA